MSAQYCGCDTGWVCEQHRGNLPYGIGGGAGSTPYIPPVQMPSNPLPTDPTERKTYPIATGVLDYFPDAIAAIAHVSYLGNEQHNPGQPLHWAREKSKDQEDTLLRHFMERGTVDKDGARHTAKMAWRALAILQLEIEEARSNPCSKSI